MISIKQRDASSARDIARLHVENAAVSVFSTVEF
jgi:hypothetical protein